VAISLNNLAVLLWAKGERAEPERLHRRALAICVKKLGEDHPITRAVRKNLEDLERAVRKQGARQKDNP
jgi:hypothetical protein